MAARPERPLGQDRAIARLQKIVREVREEDLQRSCCIGPLQAAPQALVQLGTCLKAASMSEPKAIKVGNPKSGADGSIVQLPHQYLDSNLERCAFLGWEAFTTAESGMRKLFYSTEDMLGADGTIAAIVRSFDDPETAKYHLRTYLDDVQDSVSECKQEAGKIKDKFDFLVRFISALYEAVTEKKNSTAEEKKQKEEDAAEAENSEKRYELEQDRLEQLMNTRESAVEEANNAHKSAQKAVDKAAKDDETKVMSIAEITTLLEREEETRTEESIGAFTELRNFWFGKSASARKREKESEQEWRDRRDKKMKELMEARQIEIGTVKKAALERLQETRAIAQDRQKDLDDAQRSYQNMVYEHLSASRSRQIAHGQLQQLLAQKIDLNSVGEIIEESLSALQTVDRHIKLLYGFFEEIEVNINAHATSLTKQFLHPIENSIRQSGNTAGAKIVENFKIAPDIKRSLINNTLKLEGRFSLAHDMSAVYVTISKQYILPGLDRLSDLTKGNAVAAQVKYEDFRKWEGEAVLGISNTIIQRRKQNFSRMEAHIMELAREAKLIADVGDGQLPREAEVEEL